MAVDIEYGFGYAASTGPGSRSQSSGRRPRETSGAGAASNVGVLRRYLPRRAAVAQRDRGEPVDAARWTVDAIEATLKGPDAGAAVAELAYAVAAAPRMWPTSRRGAPAGPAPRCWDPAGSRRDIVLR